MVRVEKIIAPIEVLKQFLRLPAAIARVIPSEVQRTRRLRVALDGWGGEKNYNAPHQQLTGLAAWFKRQGLKAGTRVTISLGSDGLVRLRTGRHGRKSGYPVPPPSPRNSGWARDSVLMLHVNGRPPMKPSKGKEAKEQLREIAEARMTVLGLAELRGKFALRIRYRQAETAWDAANVVGGIADALSKCVYRDDRNLREIQCQVEEGGGQDEYWVTVEPKW